MRAEPDQPQSPPPPRPPRKVTTRIEIPPRTILTVVLAVAALWLFGRLWHQLLLFFIAILVAAAFDPPIARLEGRGWRRGQAVALLAVICVAIVALLVTLVVPPVVQQAQRLAVNLPGYVNDIQGLVQDYPVVQRWLQNNANQEAANPATIFGGVLSFGSGLFSGIANLLILLTLAIYLMLDGPRLFDWITEDMPAQRRERARRIRREVSRAVGAYARGQLIVSSLFAAFTFVTLTVAGTPEPLLLAVLAAFLDAIPLVGATIATVPAVLLSLTVSIPSGLLVLALYVVYQQVENYLIIPRVYRGALQIPSLAVLGAVIIGSTLLGIIGALLSLPVAAAVPTVLRAWREEKPDRSEPAAGDPRDTEAPA